MLTKIRWKVFGPYQGSLADQKDYFNHQLKKLQMHQVEISNFPDSPIKEELLQKVIKGMNICQGEINRTSNIMFMLQHEGLGAAIAKMR